MDGREWLADYQRRVQHIGARAARAHAELKGVEATATSRDGAVTVTVTPAGALRRLAFGERAEGLTRVQLAAAVLTTAAQAQSLAAHQALDVVTPLLGAQSEAMRVLRDHLPEPVEGGR